MPDAGRVITGRAGGLRLLAPGGGTRPLSDKVKQALFGLIESALPDPWAAPMLDLFAGSGAAGIEALSRGAPHVVFVERDPGAARIIGQNLIRTGLRAGVVVRREAVAWLAAGAAGAAGAADAPDAAGAPGAASAASTGQHPFRVVVVDPPYDRVVAMSASLGHLGDPSLAWLEPDACVVAKHFWRDTPGELAGALRMVRTRRFGETALSVYRHEAPRPPGGK